MPRFPLLVALLGISGRLGLTMILSIISDALSLLTVHVYCGYLVATAIFSQILSVFGSLWRLFRGKSEKDSFWGFKCLGADRQENVETSSATERITGTTTWINYFLARSCLLCSHFYFRPCWSTMRCSQWYVRRWKSASIFLTLVLIGPRFDNTGARES